ncbi:MAG: replication factor C large subunit [Nanoarchaeota archaeon]|nr:replication factor C large subunit [Nanoarchaeota archaeon]
MQWTEKYRPEKFEDVHGQREAIEKIKIFIKYFGTKKKALILYGPPGTGKTTIAHVIANELNSEIFELNASDFRDKSKLKEILKPAIEQKSLTKKGKVILVDEADGISGYYDRGGISELLYLITSTSYPIIITANDVWNKKLSLLRKKAELVQLKEIGYQEITKVMINILRKENLFLNPNILTSLATRAKGDLRAAINDLQSVSRMKDPSLLTIDERNKETDIFNALRTVFKELPTKETLNIFDPVNMPIDEIILWVEENIPLEYKGKELAKAYERLSKVDVFKGRIYKQQYWRFLVYENILLSYGISASKDKPKTGFTSYKKPSRILKIWLNNQRTAKKKSIAQKYAKHVHVGQKRALSEFPIIKQIIKSNPSIKKELRLNDEEIEYVMR